jgi:hypothetical protein
VADSPAPASKPAGRGQLWTFVAFGLIAVAAIGICVYVLSAPKDDDFKVPDGFAVPQFQGKVPGGGAGKIVDDPNDPNLGKPNPAATQPEKG